MQNLPFVHDVIMLFEGKERIMWQERVLAQSDSVTPRAGNELSSHLSKSNQASLLKSQTERSIIFSQVKIKLRALFKEKELYCWHNMQNSRTWPLCFPIFVCFQLKVA